MKAASLLIFVSFFTIPFAEILTEDGPDGKIAALKYTPDGDTLPKQKRAPKTETAIVHNGVQPTSLISVVTVLH